jgi:hypothetical protein
MSLGVERTVQEEVVVDGHGLVGHAHRLPEDLLRRFRHPDVVAERLAHALHAVRARQDRHRERHLLRYVVGLLNLAREEQVEGLVGAA